MYRQHVNGGVNRIDDCARRESVGNVCAIYQECIYIRVKLL